MVEVKFKQDSGSRDMFLPITTYYPSQYVVRISIISETIYFRYICVWVCAYVCIGLQCKMYLLLWVTEKNSKSYCSSNSIAELYIFNLTRDNADCYFILFFCFFIFLIFLFFYFFNFYCYSITVVCLFSPSLHPTPVSNVLKTSPILAILLSEMS